MFSARLPKTNRSRGGIQLAIGTSAAMVAPYEKRFFFVGFWYVVDDLLSSDRVAIMVITAR